MEQERKSYQEKAHRILDELFAQIDSLEGRIQKAGESIRGEVDKTIEELKARARMPGRSSRRCAMRTPSRGRR
jgi:nitric oxide synthase oxygenase domain/subunit